MFNAFSPLNGGNFSDALSFYAYPLELGIGLDYTRQRTVDWDIPYPVVTGYVQGLVPFFDEQFVNTLLGPSANGPYYGDKIEPFTWIFPNLQGGASKVTG